MKLRLKHDITVGLDLRGVLPERLLPMSAAEVAQVQVWEGNHQRALGELFEIDVDDQRSHGVLRIVGDLAKADFVGAEMTQGKLFVQGKVGHHAGQAMRGGSLIIHGHVGNNLAEALRGGLIKVLGNVGNRVGAPLPGEKRGMSGGTVVVLGSAGSELGHRMRRGLIVVAGDCQDYVGYEMLAGTIVVGGKVGAASGLSMRRGTIVLHGNAPADLLAGFTPACRFRPTMMPMLAREMARLEVPEVASIFAHRMYDLYHGDLAQLGRGEILLPA